MVSFDDLLSRKSSVAVVGLGYVGLPLAVALSRHFDVIGFDINTARVEALTKGHDATNEVDDASLAASTARFTSDAAELGKAGVIIVAVPTPVDSHRTPDLTPVIGASRTVGRHMPKGCVVCYESTVYPGVTEDECIPLLVKESGMNFPADFTVGYSPERINPGDKVHRLETIRKVVSGSDEPTADLLVKVYGAVVTAGIHRASCIKVAEAAKVIENTQRDINIALMNELSLIFARLGIDTLEVLHAAGTKWNFLPFRPGLVGGHCIGVDPYYLTHKAQEVGYHPEVILAGRRVNDNMAVHVADATIKLMLRKGFPVLGSKVLVLGLTFKENCPDVRNTKVVDIVRTLQAYHAQVDIYDPWIDTHEAQHEYGLQCLTAAPALGEYAAIILAVGHHQFVEWGEVGIKALGQPGVVLFDVKSILPLGAADGRL